MTIPMIGGLLLSSTVVGHPSPAPAGGSRSWSPASSWSPLGFGLLSTIDHQTRLVLFGVFMVVLGVGVGMTMQNLVLAVQNTVAARGLGAASSAVAFFRSLGGAIGVSVLGAVLSSHVGDLIRQGLADIPGGRRRPPRGGSVGLADFKHRHRRPIREAHPGVLRRRDRPDLPDLGGDGPSSLSWPSCSSARSHCARRAVISFSGRFSLAEAPTGRRPVSRNELDDDGPLSYEGGRAPVVRSESEGGVQGDLIDACQCLAHRAARPWRPERPSRSPSASGPRPRRGP